MDGELEAPWRTYIHCWQALLQGSATVVSPGGGKVQVAKVCALLICNDHFSTAPVCIRSYSHAGESALAAWSV